jgi:hypothetical protein
MLKQVARSWSVVVYVALRAGAIIEHAVEPEEEYWPDAHVAQELEEADDEYLPAEHSTKCRMKQVPRSTSRSSMSTRCSNPEKNSQNSGVK